MDRPEVDSDEDTATTSKIPDSRATFSSSSTSKTTGGPKPNYTDEHGYEFEWDANINGYVPILTENLLLQNQNNYEYIPEEYGVDDQGRQTFTDPETKEVYTWIPSEPKKSLAEGLDDGQNNDDDSSDGEDASKKSKESELENPESLGGHWINSKGEVHVFEQKVNASKSMFDKWTLNEVDGSYSDQYGQKWTYDFLRCKYLNDDGWFLVEEPLKQDTIEAIEPESGNHYRFDGESKKWGEIDPEEEEAARKALKSKEELEQEAAEEAEKNKRNSKKRKKNEWVEVDEDKQTTVYVTGLPPATVTVLKFEDMMKKYGILKVDPVRDQPKLKLYKDRQTGVPKGDGVCTYEHIESVNLAIQMLHNFPCPLDETLTCTVEKAKFEQKGDSYDSRKNKKRRKLTKKEKATLDKRKEKLMAWTEKDEMTNAIEHDLKKTEKPVNKKILIFKNCFDDPKIFNSVKTQHLTEKIRVALRNLINSTLGRSVQFEDEKEVDRVKKLILFDRNVEGVCSVAFKSTQHAAYIKNELDGKMFLCQGVKPGILSVDYWDGHTNYLVEENTEELEVREQDWLKFLHGES